MSSSSWQTEPTKWHTDTLWGTWWALYENLYNTIYIHILYIAWLYYVMIHVRLSCRMLPHKNLSSELNVKMFLFILGPTNVDISANVCVVDWLAIRGAFSVVPPLFIMAPLGLIHTHALFPRTLLHTHIKHGAIRQSKSSYLHWTLSVCPLNKSSFSVKQNWKTTRGYVSVEPTRRTLALWCMQSATSTFNLM